MRAGAACTVSTSASTHTRQNATPCMAMVLRDRLAWPRRSSASMAVEDGAASRDRLAANVDIRGQCDRLPRRQHKTTHTSGSVGHIKLLTHVEIRVVVELGHGWGRPPRTPPSSSDRQRLSHANKGRLTGPPRHHRSELGRARRADASGLLQGRAGATRPTPIVAGFQLGPSRRRSTRQLKNACTNLSAMIKTPCRGC